MSEDQARQPQLEPVDNLDGYSAQTIPVHVDLNTQQTVLSLDEAREILRDATSVAVGPCTCRKTEQRCDAPVDVCLSLNATATALAKMEGFRPISIAEAMDVLRRTHEAGLVHLAYRKDGGSVNEFCSCCSCCCWFLTRMKASGNTTELAASPFVVELDASACVGCGTCVARCHFDAWTQAQPTARPELSAAQCYGCGVCVTACPSGALSLVPRPTR